MTVSATSPAPQRLFAIAQARRAWIDGDAGHRGAAPIDPWLARSWQRCLAAGRQPRESVAFDPVTREAALRLRDANRALVEAARPVIERLSRAIADTRYFAILTDAQGVVIEVGALPGGSDAAARHARDIARVGVDLSERAIGTSAIGATLAERESVWLHRGEHFFDDTGIFSCAGAPLFGPQGDCIGMLDLTGVQAVERPELRHLAVLSARSIEDALLIHQPCELLLRIDWPGCAAGPGGQGLLAVDCEGRVLGANTAARQMLHQPASGQSAMHCAELFALPPQMLLDAARRGDTLELPLWSGLRVQVQPALGPSGNAGKTVASEANAALPAQPPRLRDVEAGIIRRAVTDARGNVAEAARALGISRATVYRKLARGRHKPG